MSTATSLQKSDLQQMLQSAATRGVTDIHLAVDTAPFCRVAGELIRLDEAPATLAREQIEEFVVALTDEAGRQRLVEHGSCDGAISTGDGQRFRFNIYHSCGETSIALRRLDNTFKSLDELGLDDDLYRVCDYRDGLVLVAGPTGSGKSTTLATLIDRINSQRKCHIVTIEDPIEYVHANKMSLVSQRQIGVDTATFATALVDTLRQDPDVILVGEMRELDTIRTAVAAAETGHLVFATVHAGDCVGTIERITSVFPGEEQTMIRNLLAGSLRTVIAQHLLTADESAPRLNSADDQRPSRNRVLASEVLHINAAAANLIASDNLQQLPSILQLHRGEGMYTLDRSLARLWRRRLISEAAARSLARNPAMLRELSRAI